MKKIIIAIVVILLIIAGVYYFTKSSKVVTVDQNTTEETVGNQVTTPVNKEQTVIGTSVSGRPITAYHFGNINATTSDEVLFVGGIHGGYEWNTALVAFETIDYLRVNPNVIPANLKVTVIPVVNPDGLAKIVSTTTTTFSAAGITTSASELAAARFNANNVDLNRNFDCDWQSVGKWQNKNVSGGTSAFSEPESLALKNYIESRVLKGVIVWYSAAGGVFSSSCHNGILTETRNLTNVFAKASGYPAHEEFNFYEITGDAVNWLAKQNIPAISVLLTNHTDTEWTKNRAGVDAVLKYFAK
jgi:hypothetical protein